MRRAVFAAAAALSLGGQSAPACTAPGATSVDEIYPSGADVPENLLRIYVYFTGPIADADVLPHIRLRHEDGTKVEGVFLSNRFDLWSPDRTRLTLLLDPGRVKTGLAAHEALGRALVPGQGYVLTIGAGVTDAAGCPLAKDHIRDFHVTPADTLPPNPGQWAIEMPDEGTRDPLRISLGSAHDHLSMAFGIAVSQNGQRVAGRVGLGAGETLWTFTPRAPWAAAPHKLTIADTLEDLAGNRPGQLFDQPIGLDLPKPPLSIEFSPRSQ